MANRNYDDISPIVYEALSSFPFIEQDFDALTTYELTSMIIDRLNTVITKVNDFENPEELIIEKINEMAEDGTLEQMVRELTDDAISDVIDELDNDIPGVVTGWLANNITQPTTPVIDKTLSISGAGADAKITGDLLSVITDIMYEESSYNWTRLASETYPYGWRTGYIGDSGTATSSSHYIRTAAFEHFSSDIEFIIVRSNIEGVGVRVSEYESASVSTFVQNLSGFDDTAVVFKPVTGHRYYFSAGYFTDSITNDTITANLVNSIQMKLYRKGEIVKKPNIVQYESGSFGNGIADGRLSIYIPTYEGYIAHRFYHCVISDIRCQTWQLYNIYHFSNALVNINQLSRTGEWECAIKLVNADYVGGHTHGYEIEDDNTFIINGKSYALSDLTTAKSFEEMIFTRHSTIYESGTTTALASHSVEYRFTDHMSINQSLTWKKSATIDNCMFGMLPIYKAYSQYYYTNINSKKTYFADIEFPVIERCADKLTYNAHGDSYDYHFAVENKGELPATVVQSDSNTYGRFISINDNELDYHKGYYRFAGGNYAVSNGDIFNCISDYYFDIS